MIIPNSMLITDGFVLNPDKIARARLRRRKILVIDDIVLVLAAG